MRITKIVVKDLFGIFNHQIPLDSDDRITIIHGPNGIWKTVLMTVTNAILTMMGGTANGHLSWFTMRVLMAISL